MDEKILNRINTLTNDFHDDAASINEELVDQDYHECVKIIDSLQKKLRNLKRDLIDNNI